MPEFTNGDFETGDLTGWSSYGIGGGSIAVAGAYKYLGSYGCRCYSTSVGNHYIYQQIDVTDISTLKVKISRVSVTADTGSKITVGLIGETPSHRIFYSSSVGWQTVYIDVSGYSGNHDFFVAAYGTGGGEADVYIDNATTVVYDRYVDIDTGDDSDDGASWANAYLTVKKGIDNVPPGKILHIAFGDYSAQASIDLDKNLELLCEDNGGGGTGTVVLPVTV